MSKKQYTLDDQGDVSILKANGINQVCPFQQPMPVQSGLAGGMRFAPVACNSGCPHFNQYSDELLVLSCGGGNNEIRIQAPETPTSTFLQP